MRHSPHDTTQTDPASCPPPPGYDWARFGRHALRVAGNAVIDFPLPIMAGSTAWIAQIWPDARHDSGWTGSAWQHDPVQGRGWLLPERLSFGDIVEFGVDRPTGRRRPTESSRWWGIVTSYDGERLLTVQGPYPSAADAHLAAERLVGVDRYQAPSPTSACGSAASPPRARCAPAAHPSSQRRDGQRHRHCRGGWME